MSKDGKLYKSLVRFNIQRTLLAGEAAVRGIMSDEEAARIARLDPSTSVDENGMPVRGGLWDEAMRQALIASLAGLKKQKAIITAQAREEVAALKDESPHVLPPITDVEIAREQADQVLAATKKKEDGGGEVV